MADDDRQVVHEGQATIHLPPHVFYNPSQVLNRDFSVIALSAFAALWQEEQVARAARNPAPVPERTAAFLHFEALSASGLRSLRYYRECPQGVPMNFIVNDLSEDAVEQIHANIRLHTVPDSRHTLTASHADAIEACFARRAAPMNSIVTPTAGKFTAIDLDPYGAPGIFLDAALQALDTRAGGMLSITCTDTQILCGKQPEQCFQRYGAVALHASERRHDLAIRTCLATVQTAAARHGLVIEPLLSFAYSFYIRTFVRVHARPGQLPRALSQLAHVHQCSRCESRSFQPLARTRVSVKATRKDPARTVTVETAHTAPSVSAAPCPFCGAACHMAGPVWTGPIHAADFIARCRALIGATAADEASEPQFATLAERQRVQGMLAAIHEEATQAGGDVPRKPALPASADGLTLSVTPPDTEDAAGIETAEPAAAAPAPAARQRRRQSLPTPVPTEQYYLDTTPRTFVSAAAMTRALALPVGITKARLATALVSRGYSVSPTHVEAASLLTDAPWAAVWDIVRAYAQGELDLAEQEAAEGVAPNQDTPGAKHIAARAQSLHLLRSRIGDTIFEIARPAADVRREFRRATLEEEVSFEGPFPHDDVDGTKVLFFNSEHVRAAVPSLALGHTAQRGREGPRPFMKKPARCGPAAAARIRRSE
jgi:tRNA(guanine-26,N2-N2) methyltransferase